MISQTRILVRFTLSVQSIHTEPNKADFVELNVLESKFVGKKQVLEWKKMVNNAINENEESKFKKTFVNKSKLKESEMPKRDLKGKRSTFKVSKNLTHTVDLLLSFIVHNGDLVQGLRISEPNSPLMLSWPDCFH